MPCLRTTSNSNFCARIRLLRRAATHVAAACLRRLRTNAVRTAPAFLLFCARRHPWPLRDLPSRVTDMRKSKNRSIVLMRVTGYTFPRARSPVEGGRAIMAPSLCHHYSSRAIGARAYARADHQVRCDARLAIISRTCKCMIKRTLFQVSFMAACVLLRMSALMVVVHIKIIRGISVAFACKQT